MEVNVKGCNKVTQELRFSQIPVGHLARVVRDVRSEPAVPHLGVGLRLDKGDTNERGTFLWLRLASGVPVWVPYAVSPNDTSLLFEDLGEAKLTVEV